MDGSSRTIAQKTASHCILNDMDVLHTSSDGVIDHIVIRHNTRTFLIRSSQMIWQMFYQIIPLYPLRHILEMHKKPHLKIDVKDIEFDMLFDTYSHCLSDLVSSMFIDIGHDSQYITATNINFKSRLLNVDSDEKYHQK